MTLQLRDRFQTPLRNDPSIIVAVHFLLTSCEDDRFNQLLRLHIAGKFLNHSNCPVMRKHSKQLNGSSLHAVNEQQTTTIIRGPFLNGVQKRSLDCKVMLHCDGFCVLMLSWVLLPVVLGQLCGQIFVWQKKVWYKITIARFSK